MLVTVGYVVPSFDTAQCGRGRRYARGRLPAVRTSPMYILNVHFVLRVASKADTGQVVLERVVLTFHVDVGFPGKVPERDVWDSVVVYAGRNRYSYCSLPPLLGNPDGLRIVNG